MKKNTRRYLYKLTPSRKSLATSLGRSKSAFARKCWKNNYKDLLKHLGSIIRSEVCAMCSDSLKSILSLNVKDIMSFKWETLIDELKNHAPTLLEILRYCTVTACCHQNVCGSTTEI